MKIYIVEWGKKHIKNKSQVPRATFLAKYGSLTQHDEDTEERKIIDHEILEFNKTDGWHLIRIPDKEYGTLSDHEYFCIHADLFDRIQSTHQYNFFCGGLYQINQMKMNLRVKQQRQNNDRIQNNKRTANKYSTKHNIQRKRQKPVDYRKNSFYDFRLMIVDPHPKLDSDE